MERAVNGSGDATPDPAGGMYEWVRRGLDLLEKGDAAAAATLLTRAHVGDPTSATILEALGRARFDAGDYAAAVLAFSSLVEATPDADYAHFGLGLSSFRLGRLDEAERHLALACAMRPDRPEYHQGLREVRATKAARRTPGGQ